MNETGRCQHISAEAVPPDSRLRALTLQVIMATGGDPKRLDEAVAVMGVATPDWQPIETVPDSGEERVNVLVWVADGGPQGTGVASFGSCYRYEDGTIRCLATGFYGAWKITHWMPLPPAPEAQP